MLASVSFQPHVNNQAAGEVGRAWAAVPTSLVPRQHLHLLSLCLLSLSPSCLSAHWEAQTSPAGWPEADCLFRVLSCDQSRTLDSFRLWVAHTETALLPQLQHLMYPGESSWGFSCGVWDVTWRTLPMGYHLGDASYEAWGITWEQFCGVWDSTWRVLPVGCHLGALPVCHQRKSAVIP